MAILAQQVGYRQANRHRERAGRIQRVSHIRLLNAAGEGLCECLRVGYTRRDTPAPVRLVADLEGVDVSLALLRIELGGILQVPYPALVHFLGDPAFVADMRVA